ncbi:MAG TPA: enolase C-terminal domain-like protein, partial [Actinoplanes sp.]|nr:enolase C-terminal domain-like protein [Actinoplanes sp.]
MPSTARIVALDVLDVRFPTSEHLDGSDAMNPEPDYSAAYVRLCTDAGDGHEGHALAFTTGRGNDVQANAIAALAPYVVGRTVTDICDDLGGFARTLVHDPQLRWLGPEKGAMHMATGAVVNAAWDLAAKRAGLPVWRFLGEMSPEELVAQVDFRWLSDALTPEEAVDILRRAEPGRRDRIDLLLAGGYPAYTTSPGWLGYTDEKLARLAREAVTDGFSQIKLKVGASVEDDVRRMTAAREAVGAGVRIAVDANQRWDVQPAIDWMREL